MAEESTQSSAKVSDNKVTTAIGEASTTIATVKGATAIDGIHDTFESIRENFVSIYGDAAIPYKQKPEILLPLIARMRSAADQITDKTQKATISKRRQQDIKEAEQDLQWIVADIARKANMVTSIDSATPSSIHLAPFILIGAESHASDKALLQKMGVTHILNAAAQCKCHFPDAEEFKYLHIKIYDSTRENIKKHFDTAIAFIDAAKTAKGRVLVHCQQGISRSGTLVIAWLIARKNLTWPDALTAVKQSRKIVKPNNGFKKQLQIYEHSLRF